MADPFAIFRDAAESKQNLLSQVWPELYDCLARAGEARSAVTCVMGDCGLKSLRTPAVGRVTLNGHPACAEHIRTMSNRPGGYPLRRTT